MIDVKLISTVTCAAANILIAVGIGYNQPNLEMIGGIVLACGIGYYYAVGG